MNKWKIATFVLAGWALNESGIGRGWQPVRKYSYSYSPETMTVKDTIRNIINRKLNYIFLGTEIPETRADKRMARANRENTYRYLGADPAAYAKYYNDDSCNCNKEGEDDNDEDLL